MLLIATFGPCRQQARAAAQEPIHVVGNSGFTAASGVVDPRAAGTAVENRLTATRIPPLPERASAPNPHDGATGVSPSADLSRTPGSDATSHDVYLGTGSAPAFQANQAATTFDPGRMGVDTTHYRRIDEVNCWGKTRGTLRSFTTVDAPPPP